MRTVVLAAVWTLVISLVSGLGGTFLGFYLTKQWQRKQWQRDIKLQEYREVLSVLAKWHLTLRLSLAKTALQRAHKRGRIRKEPRSICSAYWATAFLL